MLNLDSMSLNRHLRHTLALTILTVGSVTIVMSFRQHRSFAQGSSSSSESFLSTSFSEESWSSSSSESFLSTSFSEESWSSSSSESFLSTSFSEESWSSSSPSGDEEVVEDEGVVEDELSEEGDSEQNADLSLTKTASTAQVDLGDTFTYTLTVHNTSATAGAQNVSVTDMLPAGVIFISADQCALNDRQVICNIGTIASGSSVIRNITIQVQENQSLCSTNLLNIAVVSSTYDPNIGNNTAGKTTPVLCAEEAAFTPFCGNESCDSNETCDTCTRDCGFCPPNRPPCGDNICDGPTDCSSDCQSQAPDSLPKPLRDALPPQIYEQVIEKAPVESVNRAFTELTETIANDARFQKRLDEAGIILGDDRIPSVKLISDVVIKLREEGQEFRSISKDVLEDQSIEILFRNFPGRDELLTAARDGNLSAMLDYLPEPTMDPSVSLAEVEEYRHLLKINYPDLFVNPGSLLLPKAVADEAPLPMDAKEGLVESVFLRKRMEALGIDPKTGLALLDQDIEKLMSRKKTLAGIIGIMDEDLEKELGNAEGAIEQPTTRSLISVKGIFLYLRTTANFETLEKTYRGAVADMRTGVAKFQSLFSFHPLSPSVEAAELVGDELAASLQSPDLEEKKNGALKLFDLQNPLIESMLQEMPENERTIHVDSFARVRQEATAAKASAELEQAITLFSDALTTLESDARSERSIFRRPIYFLQDFFGRS